MMVTKKNGIRNVDIEFLLSFLLVLICVMSNNDKSSSFRLLLCFMLADFIVIALHKDAKAWIDYTMRKRLIFSYYFLTINCFWWQLIDQRLEKGSLTGVEFLEYTWVVFGMTFISASIMIVFGLGSRLYP